jgi:hypothetical protein
VRVGLYRVYFRDRDCQWQSRKFVDREEALAAFRELATRCAEVFVTEVSEQVLESQGVVPSDNPLLLDLVAERVMPSN